MIFGVTRFSVFSPASNAWKASREMTEEKYKAYLFSKSRLSGRLLIMQKFTIPNLKRLSEMHKSFHHFITYSRNLPNDVLASLFSMVSGHDNLHVVEHTLLMRSIKDIIRTNSSTSAGMYALFNLDDDDLVAHDYVTKLFEYVNPSFSGWVVSFGLGISALFDSERGEFHDFRECHHPKINIGLAFVNPYAISADGVDVGCLDRPRHPIIDRERKVVLDSREFMWVWGRHVDQDTLIYKDAASSLKAKQDRMQLVSSEIFEKRFRKG